MSFVKKILSPGAASAKRDAQATAEAERSKLRETQRLESIETKKAEELKIKVAGQSKRRLRRRAGGGTALTSPLGVSGGGRGIDSKVLLGL